MIDGAVEQETALAADAESWIGMDSGLVQALNRGPDPRRRLGIDADLARVDLDPRARLRGEVAWDAAAMDEGGVHVTILHEGVA